MSEAPNDGRPGLLDGKVALVVGASRGIGAVTARALARAGAKVMLAARDGTALEAVADGIRREGHEARAATVDVGDEASVGHLIGRLLDVFGRLDVAFNNATDGSTPRPLADMDVDAFDRAIRTNIRGTFLGMKHQIPAMLATGGGSIINMASLAGVQGVANLAGYVTGKAGVIALTKVAALDYADRGVRVNVLAPGPILTHHLEAAGEAAQRAAALATPMRRVGASAEIADAVLWLASDKSSFVTGVTLPIDGGQSAGAKPERIFRQPQDQAQAG
ncbi:short-chain dehydrogenase [Phenylobacterium hankyongense]|uniref:D-xylose 1-dehydrogenase n=1 Tax=Phenylobacterium hankyongense TaxID=1813876 RepID=A0A328B353_9CAUL|nr:SDR family NAD(P)-dependent oxidoreductase [Phenylobacterium hankyongense]RAK59438.1 short-chain dehydrogenase [Phenylobacterium hankyongense]